MEPTLFMFKRMWRFSPSKPRVILFLSLETIANLVDFLNPLIIAWLLNEIQTQGLSEPYKLLGILSLLLVTTLGFWAFHGPARYIERKNAFLVQANYKQHLIDGTLSLDAKWHSEHHSGDTIDRINTASTALFQFSQGTFVVVETIVKLTSSYIALIYFNLHSIYIVGFLTVIAIWIMLSYDKRLQREYKQLNEYNNQISQQIFDALSNITTILILKIERLLSRDISKRLMRPFRLYGENVKKNEYKWFWVNTIAVLMTVGVLASYIMQHWFLGITIAAGTLYALYGYVERITGLFYSFAYNYGDLVRQQTAIENVAPIEREFREEDLRENVVLQDWKKIRIDNLRFSYHGKESSDLHLTGVYITINKGEKIALVGESGSGKTTFLKMLRGLYEPQHIEVFVDERKLKSLKSLSENISLIPQEPELFSTTIKENITLGLRYSQKTVEEACEIACFDSVIRKLPKGHRTLVTEKGVKLSGGEKQRLALTRGILASKKKQIVLLDEPTSNVDSRNERNIYKNIFQEFGEKTVISTVHSLHLLPIFDSIYVFDKGEIVAWGTLDQLKESSPHFQEMWKRAVH